MPETFDIESLAIPDDSEIKLLVEKCPDIERALYKDGEYLTKEGTESKETFIVLRGSFVVEQQKASGSESRGEPIAVVNADVHEPSFIGEMAYLGSAVRSASVRCSGAVHALVLHPNHIEVVLNEFPTFSRVLSRQLTERLQEADRIIKHFRQKLELAAKHEIKQDGDEICARGEKATKLFQLVDGQVLVDSPSGVTTIRATNSPNDFLNAAEYLAGGVNRATIRAKTSAILVVIEEDSRLAVIRNFPELALEAIGNDK